MLVFSLITITIIALKWNETLDYIQGKHFQFSITSSWQAPSQHDLPGAIPNQILFWSLSEKGLLCQRWKPQNLKTEVRTQRNTNLEIVQSRIV